MQPPAEPPGVEGEGPGLGGNLNGGGGVLGVVDSGPRLRCTASSAWSRRGFCPAAALKMTTGESSSSSSIRMASWPGGTSSQRDLPRLPAMSAAIARSSP